MVIGINRNNGRRAFGSSFGCIMCNVYHDDLIIIRDVLRFRGRREGKE